MSNTRPIEQVPQLWCAKLWVLPANQQKVIQTATLRVANSLDVAIISIDDSIMDRFWYRMWLLPQIHSWSSNSSIFRTRFLKYGHGTQTNKIMSTARCTFSIHYVLILIFIDNPCMEALPAPLWIICSEAEFFLVGLDHLSQIWGYTKEAADFVKTIFTVDG